MPPAASPVKRNYNGKPIDPRFNFNCMTKDWRLRVDKQPILSSEIQVLEQGKSNERATFVFELPPTGILLPGNSSRFHVEGIFEMSDAETPDTWIPIPNTEAANVMVCTNWFEKLIERVQVFTGNQSMDSIHYDPTFLPPYLHEMLYAHMDADLKKFLCIEDCHPGHSVVTLRDEWDFEKPTWIKYAASVFKDGKFKFTWIPLNMWPLFQNGSFILDTDCPPRAVPLSLFDIGNKVKISCRTETQLIFKKKAENTKQYRFRFIDMKLALEMGMENPKQLPFSNKSSNELKYLGSSTKSTVELLPSSGQYQIRMDHTYLPPSLLIFVLPESLSGGLPKSDIVGFSKHRIETISVKFNQQKIYDSSPNFKYKELGLDEPQDLLNHYNFPIANIPVDKKSMTFELLQDDGTKYAFPHLYIRLTCGYEERNIPFNVNYKMFTQPGVLDIDVKFIDGTGPEAKSSIICLALYNDFNAIANLKTKQIVNPYNDLLL